VSAANVQLVVREISTGDVVGDHRETVGPRSAGRFLNLQAVDEAGRRKQSPSAQRRRRQLPFRSAREGAAQMQIGAVPESTATLCCTATKLESLIEMLYCRWDRIKVKLPASSVRASRVNSDVFAFKTTWMPETGRCCGS